MQSVPQGHSWSRDVRRAQTCEGSTRSAVSWGWVSPAGVGPLRLTKSRVNAPICTMTLEHFMLQSADCLYDCVVVCWPPRLPTSSLTMLCLVKRPTYIIIKAKSVYMIWDWPKPGGQEVWMNQNHNQPSFWQLNTPFFVYNIGTKWSK